MASREQIKANRMNAQKSCGPRTIAGKERSKMNALKTGMRAKTEFLPHENPLEFHCEVDDWVNSLGPRDPSEMKLVLRIARGHWMLERVEGVQDERLASRVEHADDLEDIELYNKFGRLFQDRRGPHNMYANTKAINGDPRPSWSGGPVDPDAPFVVLKEIEATPKGCQGLIDYWLALRERTQAGEAWQPQDRLKAIRMMGKQPIDAVEDKRVVVIYLASYALKPTIGVNAYDDLEADMDAIEHKAFLNRIRTRWPLVLDAGKTDEAKTMLLDLIDRNIERLQAKLDVYKEHAEERARRRSVRLGFDYSRDGETLRRV